MKRFSDAFIKALKSTKGYVIRLVRNNPYKVGVSFLLITLYGATNIMTFSTLVLLMYYWELEKP